MENKILVRDWEGIIIHHSDTKDDADRNDWAGIRAFHKSWRYRGEMIIEENARKLLAAGVKGVEAPWYDIGYHFGIESIDGHLIVQIGRTLFQAGAHCLNKNLTHLGICCVGNFDLTEPTPAVYRAAASLCVNLMIRFPKIIPKNIEPHRKYSSKTCPGKKFNMGMLLNFITEHALIRHARNVRM